MPVQQLTLSLTRISVFVVGHKDLVRPSGVLATEKSSGLVHIESI